MDSRLGPTHHGDDLARVSPELALVDPELGRRLRRRHRIRPPRRRPPLPVLRLVPAADTSANVSGSPTVKP